jgi:acyl carrier protein
MRAAASRAHAGVNSGVGKSMSLRSTIFATFQDVASGQDKTLAPLTDDLVLLESGMDSLCFALVVATLEDELGFDPFTEAEDVFFPVTLGEFVQFYDGALVKVG